ncbi:multiple monosaccharide ABC transporter substrate-binding protein [Streptomyces sp. GC420]|uniref:multiple monosaccharide ABC transporter substrate-binding protein n=1 Tax=Streptomyces sp. GC420 TaxID=2697568 RepID=UPI00141512E1|nr:multiple monosaccharide ABC transporter substrate-binding protein [Streptomyces sp. GC420]NBM14705.1 substrate-binding domain-containing protein [Streptomyces sp. GC420]
MHIRTTAAAAVSVSVVLTFTLTACGEDSGGSAGGRPSEDAMVGIAMPTKASERWLADGKNMVDQLEDLGYRTTLQYGEDDPKIQLSQIESMISKGVDALVIASIDGRALGDVLKKAAEADIAVFAYDRLILDTPDVDYYASFDNEKVGELQATYIVENLGLVNGSEKGPFSIELFAGSPDDNNTRYFWQGALNVLKPYVGMKQLVVKSGQTKMNQVTTLRWDGGTAQKRMNRILASSYGAETVDAVLSPYDGMSLGILAALKSNGYGAEGKQLPIVTGQDAEVPSIKSIIRDEQTMTVYKDTRKLALVTATMVDSVLNGSDPVVNDTKTYDNGKKVVPAYLLEPVGVDKENYENELVDSGYIEEKDLG